MGLGGALRFTLAADALVGAHFTFILSNPEGTDRENTEHRSIEAHIAIRLDLLDSVPF